VEVASAFDLSASDAAWVPVPVVLVYGVPALDKI
jgi:hypothetical protein